MRKIYISKKQAKLSLRAAGFSVAAAADAVAAMPARTFGKREKVKAADLRRIIEGAAKPTPVKPLTIRPCVSRRAAAAQSR